MLNLPLSVPEVITVERDAQMLHDYYNDTHGFGPPPENVTVFGGDSIARFDDIADESQATAPNLKVRH
mgnify:CR=1 FL=1